jgi:hypothetical protein
MLHLRDTLTGQSLRDDVWSNVEATLVVKIEERGWRKGNRPRLSERKIKNRTAVLVSAVSIRGASGEEVAHGAIRPLRRLGRYLCPSEGS